MQDFLLYVINIEIVFKIVYRVSCTVTWRELSGTLINARQTWTGSYPGRHGLVHTQVDMIYDDIRFCCHRSSFDLVTLQLLKCFGSCYSVRIKRGDINGEGGGGGEGTDRQAATSAGRR